MVLTPVKAVPDRAQAKGSRYQGEMWMRYREAAMDTMLISTALQDLPWSTSNTCVQGRVDDVAAWCVLA